MAYNNDCFKFPCFFFLQESNDSPILNMTGFVVGIPITGAAGGLADFSEFGHVPGTNQRLAVHCFSCVFITEMTVIPPKKGERCTFFEWARNNPY